MGVVHRLGTRQGASSAVTVGLCVGVLCLSGCAGVLVWDARGGRQSIDIVTTDAGGQPVTGLACRVHNDRGQWALTVPGRLTVTGSAEPLQFECGDARQEVPSADERRERAQGVARKHGVAGALFVPAFLGALVASPAALVYLAAGAATGAAVGAADRYASDTITGRGYRYPERIELRIGATRGPD